MALEKRIEALRQRHHQKEIELHAEETRPAPDTERVHRIKCEKLHLKDELMRLEGGGQQQAA